MWDQVERALNDSTTRVITSVARLLPGVLALVVAVLIAALVAWIVRVLLRRSLLSVHFDERTRQWGGETTTGWSGSQSPTTLVTRCVSWLIMFVGFLIGISAFDATLTSRLVMRAFEYLPNLFAAIVVLILGSIVARFLARGVLIGAVNMNLQHARLLSIGVKWLVLVVAGAMSLDHLGIGGRIIHLAFGLLFGGIVLALALAVGLGSKDMVSRSLERQASKTEEIEEPFRHL
jgi:Conserved TM helix